MRAFVLAITVVAVSILGFVAGDAQTRSAPACTSVFVYRAIEKPLAVAPGLTVRLRNPYGPFVSTRRSSARFGIVYVSKADRAKVASVQWGLDGGSPAPSSGDRDHYGLAPLTPGRHVITVIVTPVGGRPAVSGEIAFTVTPCEPVFFSASADNRKAPGRQPSAFNVYSGGAPLSRVQIGARPVLVSTEARLRGRKVGELRFGNSKAVLALRLPVRPSSGRIVLLRRGRLEVVLHPAARRFLAIVGLDRDSSNLHLSFGGPRVFGELPNERPQSEHAGTPGLIGTRARCHAPQWQAWVTGETGPTVRITSKNSRYAACLSSRSVTWMGGRRARSTVRHARPAR